MKFPATSTGWNSGSMGTSDGRRFGLTITVILTLGAVVLAGIGFLTFKLITSMPEAPTPAASPVASAPDPYAWYLDHAPAGAPYLSREDAQTRAFLGCGQTFAQGTVDAVLAEAYKGICK